VQQVHEDLCAIEAALRRGAEDGGEDLLCVCAACGAVAAPDSLRVTTAGAGLFGAPVGPVERGAAEETKDRVELGDQMDLKALDPRRAASSSSCSLSTSRRNR